MATSTRKFIARNRGPRVQIEYDIELYGAEKKFELPFVVGVLADLSGQPAQPSPAVAERKFLDVDIDNIDRRMSAIRPRVVFTVADLLQGEGEFGIELAFESLDDFTPASVAKRVRPLELLLLRRQALVGLNTYMDGKVGAEDLIAKVLQDGALLEELKNAPDAAGHALVGGQALSRLLDDEFRPKSEPASAELQQALVALAIEALACQSPVSSDASKAIQDLVAALDRRLSRQLDAILHHERFQQLEGAWRGLHYLVSNTESDETLKIRFISISKTELARTLNRYKGTAWDQSPLFRRLHEDEYGQFGGEPFGCLVGDYLFTHAPDDVELLGDLARICSAAHTPFISGVSADILQLDSWQQVHSQRSAVTQFVRPEYARWRGLRESDDSRYIGLAMPRFLAREPYGEKSVAVEEFAFEEDTGGGEQALYTWCNAAYALAVCITRSFKLYGWCARIRGIEGGGAVEGLPVHRHTTSTGQSELVGPVEIEINDRLEAQIAAAGFMSLQHRKGSDFAAFVSACSLHMPATYGDAEASANAKLAIGLPYLFACCRFAQYLKCHFRDRIGSFMQREEAQRLLNEWIQNYVDGDPGNSSELARASKPLAAAEIQITDVEGNPGYYSARFFLRPHYQLDPLTSSLRLVSRLPSGKALT